MTLNEIIKAVSAELGIPEEVVKATYHEYWQYIRGVLASLPLKEELTQEEFSKLRTNINIPSLGKLNCTYERYVGMKTRFNIIKKIRNKV